MSLKEDVEQFLQLKESIIEKYNDLILEAGRAYIEADKKLYVASGRTSGYNYPSDPSYIHSWDITEDSTVLYEWSETWAYGGYAAGEFELSLDFILNYEKRVKELLEDIPSLEENRKKSERARLDEQIKQLESAKAKL